MQHTVSTALAEIEDLLEDLPQEVRSEIFSYVESNTALTGCNAWHCTGGKWHGHEST